VARKTGAARAAKQVDHTRHSADQRTNIPTSELEAFAATDEKEAKTVLYPRDPSLDPQLVWKGKDEQDAHPLEVPSVPIYIQEHISPQALIEDLRASSTASHEQLDLFGDFNRMELEERVEFYQHAMKWSNRMILGDSLLVMTSLAEKEGLKGQVQTIYVDPPYGIKFGSNWQVSTRKRDVRDKESDATRQPEQVRAYRDTWELGIHSYLAYLRDRLAIARELLAQSGSIFVQIGDENVHLVRSVIDEIFGADNFVSLITFAKTGGQADLALGNVVDYLIWYARDRDRMKVRPLLQRKSRGGTGSGEYSWLELPDGVRRRITKQESDNPDVLPEGTKFFIPDNLTSADVTATGTFDYQFRGGSFYPKGGHWKTTRAGLDRLAVADRLIVQGVTLRYVRFFDDFPVTPISNLWADTAARGWFEEKTYVVQTTSRVIERCILMTSDPGDLILDPTCGSGTTAYVAEAWGRRWITLDTSRVALALARSRLMGAKYPWYLLADSESGVRKEAELTGHAMPSTMPAAAGDVRRGFVYERVPHVTLKSIAQNPDIHEGMRREEIDAAIARYAETEILFDRPYEDGKVVRVSGPFTVESLSPHRSISSTSDGRAADGVGQVLDQARFLEMVLENLRKAGVQNQVKDQRLEFQTMERFAGRAIQAEGLFDEGEARKRAAVVIGPQYGTVGTELVREAAKEAAGWFDLLVICGFAFDDRAQETSSVGNLPIVFARMNADLILGDDLKKTGAGNLFTVFGQPDIEIRTTEEGLLQADIRGIDVYDPTTGELRSDSPDEIACWFIDTDYNGESFFVRHAYFPGGDQPYEKLRRALKAEIDEAAWESLYSATSRPFPRPESGKIAVKVINHYGDEIMKVYEV
jgi:adenine-specific DNA-methyltransferase